MNRERLDKFVADRCGVTRKEAKLRIRRGLVLLNNHSCLSPDEKVGPQDVVAAEGRELAPLGCVCIMLNKPQDVVCATRDNRETTVLDLLPPYLRRKGLFPAGRLDKDTEGFVLITDDGALAHRLLAPKNHIPKTYFAILDGPVDSVEMPAAFAQGMELGGGDRTSPAQLHILENKECAQVILTIYEGMYHQVKRMFHQFSRQVTYLRRDAIGGLSLDRSLALGEAREMTPQEQELLWKKEETIHC